MDVCIMGGCERPPMPDSVMCAYHLAELESDQIEALRRILDAPPGPDPEEEDAIEREVELIRRIESVCYYLAGIAALAYLATLAGALTR